MPSRLRPDLIARLYAAALEDDVLARVSQIIREALDADSTSMYLLDGEALLAFDGTPDIIESGREYLEYYRGLDPWKAGRHHLIDTPYLGTELIADAELLATEFYNDFAIRYGVRRPIGMRLGIESGVTAAFGVSRIASGRLMTEEDKPVTSELGFHIRAALRLHRRHLLDRGEAAWQRSAFEALRFGVVICTADAGVLYANRAALDLERQGAGLVIGTLARGMRALKDAQTPLLTRMIRLAATGTPGALGLTGSDGVMLSVLATPLAPDGPLAAKPWKVLLSLRRADAGFGHEEARLRQWFGLSPAQARLCLQLADGRTFEEAAAELGMALATARAHFRTILAKTRARNLRDLLKLLASLPQVGA